MSSSFKLAFLCLVTGAFMLAGSFARADADEMPRWNLRTDPWVFVGGETKVRVDHAVARAMTAGLEMGYFPDAKGITGAETKLTATRIGARLTWHLEGLRFVDGWYAAGGADVMPLRLRSTIGGTDYSGTAAAGVFGGWFGRQWFWDSGFNFNVGAGLEYFATPETITAKNAGGGSQPLSVRAFDSVGHGLNFAGELAVGWSF